MFIIRPYAKSSKCTTVNRIYLNISEQNEELCKIYKDKYGLLLT